MKRAEDTATRYNTARFSSHSYSETVNFAAHFASSLLLNDVVALCGELGVGKTAFVKGIARGLGALSEEIVSSPTFSYLHIYNGEIPLYHFDLYRLHSEKEFALTGFEEYFSAGGITCIEWPEYAVAYLPKEAIYIDLSHRGTQKREILVRRNL